MNKDKDLIQKISEEIEHHFTNITIEELEQNLIDAGIDTQKAEPVLYPMEYGRMLTPKECERFNEIFEKELKPFFDENAEEIESAVSFNPEMKQQIEKELREIDESKPQNWHYTHITRGEN